MRNFALCVLLCAATSARADVAAVRFAAATAGESAAVALAEEAADARVLDPGQGPLAIPPGVTALWWHSETVPAPAAMLSRETREALLRWVEEGGGLLLSGAALAYVRDLGLEPSVPRITATGGVDSVAAGVSPTPAPGHPIYAGFDAGAPIPLSSAGYPAFGDFWSSGGPVAGTPIGDASPNAGERPLVEYAYGKGRVLVMGWRLPNYGLAENAHAGNLRKLTANALAYLEAGKWCGDLEDCRVRVAIGRLEAIDLEAARLAIEDMAASFPDRYARADEFLAALETYPEVREAALRGDADAPKRAEELAAAIEEALLANPLLDFEKLLLIQRGEANLGLPMNWQSNSCLARTGYDNEIMTLSPVSPSGELRTLYRPSGGEFVGDVDLHFDGSRMLFSMPAGGGPWRLFEMASDGSRLHELPLIPDEDVSNYDACYLPNGNILFSSTAPFVGVPCVTGSSHVSNFYLKDMASGTIRRLTFEQDHDWCPTVMNDGRVLYLRWEYSDIPHFVSRILFTMAPDGTDQREFYGSNSYWPNSMFYARPIPGSATKFITIVGGHHDNPRMGELVLFDASKGKHEADGVIQRIPGRGQPVEPIILDGLTQASWPRFLHPYPLSDKYFLVSCKPSPTAPWGIYLADVFDNLTLIKERPGYALLEPLPLRPTPAPPALAPRSDPSRQDAVVYMSDVYAGNGLAGVPRGTVKSLRLFTYNFAYHGVGGQIHRIGMDGPWDIKRVLGTVPVEEDGSCYFRVPANTPISVQPLDENGQALQLMRSWMTAMPGETLSCVGCHESQSEGPPATPVRASFRAPSEIREWYGPTRGFSFKREVQPVLDAYCVRCHDGALSPDLRAQPEIPAGAPEAGYDNGSKFSPSYLALRSFVRAPTIESDMHLLSPGEFAVDTTRLVQTLRKGHYGVTLDAEAWDRLNTWMDLGSPYHGTWHEIVGEDHIRHPRERRRALDAEYAGLDVDPETISPVRPLPELPAQAAVDFTPADAPECPGWPFDPDEARSRQESLAEPERAVDLGGGVRMVLRYIPPGECVMGDAGGFPDESPRRVSVDGGFWMGALEVTNEQYALFDPTHDSRLESGDFLQFSIAERGCPMNAPEQPVVRASWNEATAFCAWLSERTGMRFSLPTEEQWEYACRAGAETPLWYGGTDADFAPFANLADATLRRIESYPPWSQPWGAVPEWRRCVTTVNDAHRVTAPVGAFAPNPWGLHDMAGNAAEWTRSAYSDTERVVRGGSWYDGPDRARSAFRIGYRPFRRVFDVGFRVVCEE